MLNWSLPCRLPLILGFGCLTSFTLKAEHCFHGSFLGVPQAPRQIICLEDDAISWSPIYDRKDEITKKLGFDPALLSETEKQKLVTEYIVNNPLIFFNKLTEGATLPITVTEPESNITILLNTQITRTKNGFIFTINGRQIRLNNPLFMGSPPLALDSQLQVGKEIVLNGADNNPTLFFDLTALPIHLFQRRPSEFATSMFFSKPSHSLHSLQAGTPNLTLQIDKEPNDFTAAYEVIIQTEDKTESAKFSAKLVVKELKRMGNAVVLQLNRFEGVVGSSSRLTSPPLVSGESIRLEIDFLGQVAYQIFDNSKKFRFDGGVIKLISP